MRHLGIAIKLLLVSTVLLGLIYPLVVTGMAQLIFPRQANGSMVKVGERVVGSQLIGQRFDKPEYFHSRPSAAGANGYDASASNSSNLGPTSKALADRVKGDIDKVTLENRGLKKGEIPADMVTTSASGLDPDITVEDALAQVGRVASERGKPVGTVTELVKSQVTRRQFGVFGEERVNVLKLNMMLDERSETKL
jgi:K+-transporting ATPase ATPase C chain